MRDYVWDADDNEVRAGDVVECIKAPLNPTNWPGFPGERLVVGEALDSGLGFIGDARVGASGHRFRKVASATDPVNSPDHYRWLPVEVIEITEHLNFCLGNVIKYVLRADHKGRPTEDLKKAAWYLQREIERRSVENP